MAYVYFNPNPAGRQIVDCVVRAICKLTGQDWRKVYIGIVVEGYANFDMPASNLNWANYLHKLGSEPPTTKVAGF